MQFGMDLEKTCLDSRRTFEESCRRVMEGIRGTILTCSVEFFTIERYIHRELADRRKRVHRGSTFRSMTALWVEAAH